MFRFYQFFSGIHEMFTMNPTKNLIEDKLHMNPTKNLIEPKLYINPTKICTKLNFTWTPLNTW
jgi:hypothetical protein